MLRRRTKTVHQPRYNQTVAAIYVFTRITWTNRRENDWMDPV